MPIIVSKKIIAVLGRCSDALFFLNNDISKLGKKVNKQIMQEIIINVQNLGSDKFNAGKVK